MDQHIGKICPNCKEDLKEGDEIVSCSFCNIPQHKNCWIENKENKEESIQNHFEIEAKYIRVNNYYYRNVFEEMDYCSNRKIIWNWGAFIFGGYWFLYRKMYLQAFGIIGIGLLWGAVESFMMTVFYFAGSIAIGMYANYIYKIHIEKLIAEGTLLNELAEEEFAKRKGGTTFIGVVMILAAIFLTSYFYYYIGY